MSFNGPTGGADIPVPSRPAARPPVALGWAIVLTHHFPPQPVEQHDVGHARERPLLHRGRQRGGLLDPALERAAGHRLAILARERLPHVA